MKREGRNDQVPLGVEVVLGEAGLDVAGLLLARFFVLLLSTPPPTHPLSPSSSSVLIRQAIDRDDLRSQLPSISPRRSPMEEREITRSLWLPLRSPFDDDDDDDDG